MPVEFVSKPLDGHEITELQYELVRDRIDVGGLSLDLTTVSHIEKAIDHVFQWLERKGRMPHEIERLAPYFGTIWPSALALTGFLLQDKIARRLTGRSVVEIGCGLAVPSIVCSRMGALVTAMDHHPDVPRFLEMNVRANEPCAIRFVANGEVESSAFMSSNAGRFDFVIASDILYEAPLVEHFAREISALAAPGATAVIADPGRPYIQSFVNVMESMGWKFELQPWTVPYQGKSHDIFVMIFVRDGALGIK